MPDCDVTIDYLLLMASLEYIAKRRAELASWESASSEKIKVYEHAAREGQLLRQDKKFE